jgi:hypothetical protein
MVGGNMIDKCCLNYDGDEDCNKCCVYGYIYSCPRDCPEAVYVWSSPKNRRKQEDDNE